MKRILTILLAVMTFISADAYKYSYTFDNIPVSQAIVKMSKENPDVNISFIYKELDRYRTHARVRTDDAFDALRSIIGIHPISIIRRGDNYYIEAMQHGDYTLRGRVVDTDAEPVAAAVVYIVSADGLKQLTYGLTDANGYFEIPCDSKDVTLRTSYLGYEDFAMSVPSSGNCGVITLNPKAVALREVIVKSGRPVTSIKGDALVTTVEGTQLEHAGTAEDVLAQVPMVLTRDGNVEVFGKGSPSIYVNGRKMTDMTELTMINSSDIKRVEVVTNPGARYDGSVKSVIRIFTRRPQGDGFSGTLRATGIMREYGQSINNVRLKYRTGGLEVFANMAGAVGKFDGKQDMEMLTNSTIRWDQILDRNGTLHMFDCLGQAGFSYLFNDNHSIGAHYNQHYTNSKSDYSGLTTVRADGELYDRLQLNSVDRNRTLPSHSTNLYYTGKVGELNIDFNTDYMWRKITNPVTEIELSAMHESSEITSCGVSRSRMFAEKLILNYPVWKGTVEVGEEYTSSRFSSDYTTDAEIVNNADSRVDENNIAAFLELNQSIGRFNIGAGVRYEHVKFDYLENGTRQSEQSKTYNNLFPSLSLGTTAGNVQLSLNYSHKTQRPSYSDLDGSIGY
ncbi:MAG: outer membrane beta-barrel protein, partial [Muribaculaceae bacterium]|nr:outer membrane beta-barrel protein [Muribaculaceae bacterium]